MLLGRTRTRCHQGVCRARPLEWTMIERYTISILDSRLAAIRDGVARYDWDQLPDAGGWSSGVGKADLRRLVDYWLERFDWRAVERRLNELPQFIADVEG